MINFTKLRKLEDESYGFEDDPSLSALDTSVLT